MPVAPTTNWAAGRGTGRRGRRERGRGREKGGKWEGQGRREGKGRKSWQGTGKEL